MIMNIFGSNSNCSVRVMSRVRVRVWVRVRIWVILE